MALFPFPPLPNLPTGPIGFLSNDGTQRYLLEIESSTGFVAYKLSDGNTLVSQTSQVSLVASASLAFWSCAGFQDTSPAGIITSLDCHGNAITHLEVRSLVGLKSLDCSYNQLSELSLEGLPELVMLDANANQLTSLDARGLQALRVLNCAGNRLHTLNLTGLAGLEILDCSDNQLPVIQTSGCLSLRDVRNTGNLIDSR